jgi:hypothetical protein
MFIAPIVEAHATLANRAATRPVAFKVALWRIHFDLLKVQVVYQVTQILSAYKWSKSSSDEWSCGPKPNASAFVLLIFRWYQSTIPPEGYRRWDKLTVDLDLGAFHDSYREKIEDLISSKLKGEAVQVGEKPKKPSAKSMMKAPRETAESLK